MRRWLLALAALGLAALAAVSLLRTHGEHAHDDISAEDRARLEEILREGGD